MCGLGRACSQCLLILCAISLLIPGSSLASVYNSNCNTSPVFAFSRALYYAQYAEAEDWLEKIRIERRPEVGQFLEQVMYFKRAYDEEKQALMEQSLQRIDNQLEAIDQEQNKSVDIEARLARANMMIHASRMHLALGNVLNAARLARAGRALLDEAMAQDSLHPDALLADGLFHYYSGSGEESLDWAMPLFGLDGERDHGIEQLERAISRSPDHAFEALRSLLADVSWNRNFTCRYSALLETQEMPLSSIFEPHAIRIAASLFCGKPEAALGQLQLLEQASEKTGIALNKVQEGWVFEARLHGLAALGAQSQLQQLAEENSERFEEREMLIQFALAKAMDVGGAHAQAVPLYQQLKSSRLDDRYRDLARVYIKQPYQAPLAFDSRRVSALQFACGDGRDYRD